MAKEIWQTISAEADVIVPFHDVDMGNMAWHGHYVKYLEIGRCALLNLLNYNYMEMTESGFYWPVIDMRIRYVKPSRFEQKIRIRAEIEEWEHRLKIRYLISDAETGARMTKAYTSQVAVRISDGEMQLASPSVLAEKIESVLGESIR